MNWIIFLYNFIYSKISYSNLLLFLFLFSFLFFLNESSFCIFLCKLQLSLFNYIFLLSFHFIQCYKTWKKFRLCEWDCVSDKFLYQLNHSSKQLNLVTFPDMVRSNEQYKMMYCLVFDQTRFCSDAVESSLRYLSTSKPLGIPRPICS